MLLPRRTQTIQHKDNDTAVVLPGAPTKVAHGSLELRFQVRHQLNYSLGSSTNLVKLHLVQDNWWNATGNQQLSVLWD